MPPRIRAPLFDPAAMAEFQRQMRRFTVAADQMTTQIVKEDQMKVESVDQIRALKQGAEMYVKKIGTKEKVTWVADGAGGFVCGDATLSFEDFASSVLNGNVSLQSPPLKEGEMFVDPAGIFYRVIERAGDMWAVGYTDATGFAGSVGHRVVDERQPGWGPVSARRLPRAVQLAWGAVYTMYRLRVAEQRLDSILASGVVPPLVDFNVTVSVNVYDEDTDEYQATPVQVVAQSRWGCACQTVGDDEIRTATDDEYDYDGWLVTGPCAPADGSPSQVHGRGAVEVPLAAVIAVEEPF